MTAAAPPAPTAHEGGLSHKQILTILVGLMMGMFLAALDQTIVATAIRTISDRLHGLDEQAWATTAYLITSTIVTPLYGKLSDIYGRKRFFITAISIFIAGSMLCTLSQSMLELSFFRAVQGVGAGGLFSLALAIIGDIVPPRDRAKYQGYFLAVFGTSSVLGPVIGGFLAGQDTLLGIDGWRWVFLVNVPIAAVALVVVSRTLHLQHHRLDHRIDWWGAAALSVSLVPLLLIAEQGRDWGWGSGRALLCYGVGIVGMVAFLTIERAMGDEAILPLRLFSNRTVGVASIASVLIGVAMFGGLACLPLYLQIVKGATPTEAGLLLLPMTMGIMAGSISSGIAISKTGRYRIFPVIGSALLTLALFAFHYVHADTALWQTMVVMVFFGVGLGFNFQPLTLAVQNAVSPRQIGVATSAATFTRQIGGTLGTAVFLSILFSTVPDKISSAMQRIAPTQEFQTALRDPANAEFAKQLAAAKAHGGGAASGSGVLKDSSFLSSLDPRLAKPFLTGFADSMDLVFIVGAAVMVFGFLVMLLLPEVELRTGSAYAERGQAHAEAQAAAAAEAGAATSDARSEAATSAQADAAAIGATTADGHGVGPEGRPRTIEEAAYKAP